jgi:hypothetical protein
MIALSLYVCLLHVLAVDDERKGWGKQGKAATRNADQPVTISGTERNGLLCCWTRL